MRCQRSLALGCGRATSFLTVSSWSLCGLPAVQLGQEQIGGCPGLWRVMREEVDLGSDHVSWEMRKPQVREQRDPHSSTHIFFFFVCVCSCVLECICACMCRGRGQLQVLFLRNWLSYFFETEYLRGLRLTVQARLPCEVPGTEVHTTARSCFHGYGVQTQVPILHTPFFF